MGTGTDPLVQRLEVYRLDASQRRATPEGGIIVRGRIARTGVLEYTNADGSVRRELRLPEDVFKPEALASFDHATVTELHPSGLVTPLSWRSVAVGHLGGTPVQDGEFAAVDIHVKHADSVRKVESGELKELSCGYQCRVDMTPGVHPKYGRYDARQYDHAGNHVALGPAGWGRSGASVSIRADGFDGGVYVSDASELEGAPYVRSTMGEAAIPTNKETPPPATTTTNADAQEARRLAGENAALKAENDRLKSEATKRADDAAAEESRERTDAAVEARVALIELAKPHLDEKGKPWSAKGKTDDAIRREVVAKLEPTLLDLPEAKGDGAEGFLAGAFHSIVKRAVRATQAVRDTIRASPGAGRADTRIPARGEREREDAGTSGTGDMIADAADASVKKTKDRWRKPKADRGPGRGAR